jgi:hypothetical protein
MYNRLKEIAQQHNMDIEWEKTLGKKMILIVKSCDNDITIKCDNKC